MALKPTSNPTDWATDSSALKNETSDYHKQYGWGIVSNIPEVPNLNEVNYWRYSVHEWLGYLDLSSDERATSLTEINNRIDSLQSSEVSYEFSNENSGNTEVTEYDTYTNQYGNPVDYLTDDGTSVSINKTVSDFNKNVLVLPPSNTANNDELASVTDASMYLRKQFRDSAYPVFVPNRITTNIDSDTTFRNRFKYSVDYEYLDNRKVRVIVRVVNFDQSLGRYDADSKVVLNQVFTNFNADIDFAPSYATKTDSVLAMIFLVDNSYFTLVYYHNTGAVFTNYIAVPQDPDESFVTYAPDARSWNGGVFIIDNLTAYGANNPLCVFVITAEASSNKLVKRDHAFSWIVTAYQNNISIVKQAFSDNDFDGYFPTPYGAIETTNDPYKRDTYAIDIFCAGTGDEQNDLLTINYIEILNDNNTLNKNKINFAKYGVFISGFGALNMTLNIGGGVLPIDPNTNLLPQGAVTSDNDTYKKLAIRSIWSDIRSSFDSAPQDGVVFVGLQTQVDSSLTAVDNMPQDTFLVFREDPANIQKFIMYDAHPVFGATSFGSGASTGTCGIASIDVMERQGSEYRLAIGYRQGSADTDSAAVIELYAEYIYNVATKSMTKVANSTLTTNELTVDEKDVWTQGSTSTFRDLDCLVANKKAVKEIVLRGTDVLSVNASTNIGISPMCMSEVFQDGHYVDFKTNEATVYVTSNPPSKPDWNGSQRANYKFGTPTDTVPNVTSTSIAGDVFMMKNGEIFQPVSQIGLLDLAENDKYSYAMSRWYDANELPSGLVVEFSDIKFIQYDAFVPGLGTVQAALDNLYANLDGVTALQAFGGSEVSSVFNNYIASLTNPRRYTASGLSLTANVPVTITHNLNQKIVQVAAYNEVDFRDVIISVTVVDDDNLMLTSTENANVSVVVLR